MLCGLSWASAFSSVGWDHGTVTPWRESSEMTDSGTEAAPGIVSTCPPPNHPALLTHLCYSSQSSSWGGAALSAGRCFLPTGAGEGGKDPPPSSPQFHRHHSLSLPLGLIAFTPQILCPCSPWSSLTTALSKGIMPALPSMPGPVLCLAWGWECLSFSPFPSLSPGPLSDL